MRKVMFTAGGPDYDRVLQESDVHMGADAFNYQARFVEEKPGEQGQSEAKSKAYCAFCSRNTSVTVCTKWYTCHRSRNHNYTHQGHLASFFGGCEIAFKN